LQSCTAFGLLKAPELQRLLMSPAQETQSMREIRLLWGRLPRKGGGLTGMVFSGDILFSSVTKVSTCNTSYILDGNFS
jgi:hypothetical protein